MDIFIKTLLCSCVLIISFTGSSGQKPWGAHVEINKKKLPWGKTYSFKRFDSQGKMVSHSWTEFPSSGSIHYVYDERGRILHSHSSVRISSFLGRSYRRHTYFQYDSIGRNNLVIHVLSEPGLRSADSTFLFYKDTFLIHRVRRFAPSENSRTDSFLTNYQYDSLGQLLERETISYFNEDSAWTNVQSISWAYDDRGNVTDKVVLEGPPENQILTSETHQSFHYDSSEKLLKVQTYNEGCDSSVLVYGYKKDRLHKTEVWENGIFLRERTKYRYGLSGRLRNEKNYYRAGRIENCQLKTQGSKLHFSSKVTYRKIGPEWRHSVKEFLIFPVYNWQYLVG